MRARKAGCNILKVTAQTHTRAPPFRFALVSSEEFTQTAIQTLLHMTSCRPAAHFQMCGTDPAAHMGLILEAWTDLLCRFNTGAAVHSKFPPPRTCIPASYTQTHTQTQWVGFTQTLAQSQWGAVSQTEQRASLSLLRNHCSPLGA